MKISEPQASQPLTQNITHVTRKSHKIVLPRLYQRSTTRVHEMTVKGRRTKLQFVDEPRMELPDWSMASMQKRLMRTGSVATVKRAHFYFFYMVFALLLLVTSTFYEFLWCCWGKEKALSLLKYKGFANHGPTISDHESTSD